jgi:hypothetical protein
VRGPLAEAREADFLRTAAPRSPYEYDLDPYQLLVSSSHEYIAISFID